MKVDQLIDKLQDFRNKWGNLDVYCDTKEDVCRVKKVKIEGSLPEYAVITIELE